MNDPAAPPVASTRRWLLALPLIGLLGWLVVTMWHWGTADLKLRWAREQMDGWTSAPAPEAWREVRNVLAEARDSHPANPEAHEQLGRLYLLRAGTRDDPVAHALQRQARASYEEALRLRPASPYTWAGLARALRALGETAAFEHALLQADRLGPWEDQVQLAVIDLGWSSWHSLPLELRDRVMAAAGRALDRRAREVVRLARAHDQQDRLCAAHGHVDALRTACAS